MKYLYRFLKRFNLFTSTVRSVSWWVAAISLVVGVSTPTPLPLPPLPSSTATAEAGSMFSTV